MSQRPIRGLYFEDFEVGKRHITPARTVTAADISNFACLTGDFNEVHSNVEYIKSTPFPDVIAHGPLVYGMAAGLQYASGINDGTILALLQIDKWRIHRPTLAGDTIHLEQEVVGKKETSNPERGIITFQREVKNQRDEVIMEMEATVMYRRRSAQ